MTRPFFLSFFFTPLPGVALGVSRHRDSGALTILVQDEVGGLQVRRKGGRGGEEEWVGVPPKRGAFVINVGNMFQVGMGVGGGDGGAGASGAWGGSVTEIV